MLRGWQTASIALVLLQERQKYKKTIQENSFSNASKKSYILFIHASNYFAANSQIAFEKEIKASTKVTKLRWKKFASLFIVCLIRIFAIFTSLYYIYVTFVVWKMLLERCCLLPANLHKKKYNAIKVNWESEHILTPQKAKVFSFLLHNNAIENHNTVTTFPFALHELERASNEKKGSSHKR